MDSKLTENQNPQAETVPDLPVSLEQANEVKGGAKLYDKACKGTHYPDVVIE